MLYYGESSDISYHPDDSIKKSISSLTAEYFPETVLNAIDQPAFHAGNYLILLQHIPEDAPLETVIVTLNLRSFDAAWIYSDLETALQKSMVLIDPRFPPLINRIRLSFKDYEIKSDEERHQQVLEAWEENKLVFPSPFKYDNVVDWDHGMAKGGYSRRDSATMDQAMAELACQYIKTYAFQIDTLNNPRIRDFDAITELARKRNWNLVFNLLAENVEKVQVLVGDELVWLIRKNRDLLVERYTRKGVIVVDNLESVPDKEYIDRNWTTEHYAQKGRMIIARNLADSLRILYPDEYQKPK